MNDEKTVQLTEKPENSACEDDKKILDLIAEIIAKTIIREVNESNRIRQDQ